jgi:sialic acid synthase SpsE
LGNTFIIAEIGNTHEGSLGLAKQFIRVAAECGVNAVKFQTHIFDAESLPNAPNPPYFKDETRKEYFDRTSFDLEQWRKLKRYSEEECNVEFISSPFSLEAVDLLENVGINIYKVPSGEVTNLPLLKKIAETEKTVLLSSGMSTWEELDQAVKTLQKYGCKQLFLLQCTSEYPCSPEEAGLNVLREMKERYDLQIGLSDHTSGFFVAIAAVTIGAEIIEKHFTLSKEMYGSDAKHSMEPDELKLMVDGVREVEAALNNELDKNKKAGSLKNMKNTFEKSIVTSNYISKGSTIKKSDLAYKKPGDGISAAEFEGIIGKKIKKSVDKDYKLSWDDLYD